jgi:hypothetical protein
MPSKVADLEDGVFGTEARWWREAQNVTASWQGVDASEQKFSTCLQLSGKAVCQSSGDASVK